MQISGFYSNTVLVGDSVMVGFRNYCARSSDPVMKQLKFLAAGSLSLHNAFWDVSSRSVHPLYMGAQRQVWESVQLMGAQRVFLFFGINDMCYGVEPTLPLYLQLVSKIKEYSPAAEITIISATYTKKDRGKGLLNNANIAAFNSNMQMLAAKNGWGFIDIATPLSDGAGNLLPAYCSDNYLHQTNSAYEVWRLAMYGYARKRLGI
jgi:lysophospholipase L1-like esterase